MTFMMIFLNHEEQFKLCSESSLSRRGQCITYAMRIMFQLSPNVFPFLLSPILLPLWPQERGRAKSPSERREGSGYDIKEVEEKGPLGSRIKGGKPQAEAGRRCCSIFGFKPESREQDIDERGLLEAEGLWLCLQMGS